MRTKFMILSFASLALLFSACQKAGQLEDESIDATDDAAFSETLYDDVFASLEIATIIAESSLKSASVTDSCPTVTITFPGEGLWPRNVEINYGTGCTGLDNIVRSGKILITLSAPRREVGSARTITFEDYYFNYVKIEGTNEIENLGENNNGNIVFSNTLTGGRITFPNDSTIEREFAREREYIAGYYTTTPWDDQCLITGSSSGKSYNGYSYTHTIVSALLWTSACRFIQSGVVEFALDGIEPFYLDYGDGTCDAIATISRGDIVKEITLRLVHPRLTL